MTQENLTGAQQRARRGRRADGFRSLRLRSPFASSARTHRPTRDLPRHRPYSLGLRVRRSSPNGGSSSERPAEPGRSGARERALELDDSSPTPGAVRVAEATRTSSSAQPPSAQRVRPTRRCSLRRSTANLVVRPWGATVRRQVRTVRALEKLRKSAAFSRSRCDGAVRTRVRRSATPGSHPPQPKTKRFRPFRRIECEPQCDGCDGQVRTPTNSKRQEICGFPAFECDGWCELQTRIFGLSLAKYRGAPRRISIRQGRTQMH
jgi:hypothetical protein